MGLRAKFAAIFFLLLILPIAAITVLELDRTMDAMVDDLADSAALLIDLTFEQIRATVVPAGADPIAALHHNTALESFVEAAQAFGKGVVYVRVEKLDGTVIFGSRAGKSEITPSFFDLKETSGGWWALGKLRALWAAHTYDMSRVLKLNDRPFAIVAVGVSTDLVASRVHRVVTGILLAAAFAAALSVLGSVFFAGLVLRPLTTITSGIEHMAVGDEQVRVPVAGSDELSVLATRFNQLSQRINQANAQWEAERSRLLGLVRSITDALLLLDKAGNILFANEEAEGRLGLPAGGLANGKPLQQFLGADNPLVRLVNIANATWSGVNNVPVEISDRAGRTHFLTSLFPLDQRPAPQGLLVVLRDMEPVRGLKIAQDQIGQLSAAVEALGPSAKAPKQDREAEVSDRPAAESRKP
jgi:PAS domain-containing protein